MRNLHAISEAEIARLREDLFVVESKVNSDRDETNATLKRSASEFASKYTSLEMKLGVQEQEIGAIKERSERSTSVINAIENRQSDLHQTVARFRSAYQATRTELRSEQRKYRVEQDRQQKELLAIVTDGLLRGGPSDIRLLPEVEALAIRALRTRLREGAREEAMVLYNNAPSLASKLSLGELRALAQSFRALGYLDKAVELFRQIANLSATPANQAALIRYSDELVAETMDFWSLSTPQVNELAEKNSDVVLHVVAHALPETQSGYTVRTHETVKGQLSVGMHPIVAVQGGTHATTERYELDGITYVPLRTSPRTELLKTQWLEENIRALVELCQEVRPAILHAHSDYLNAMIAEPAGRALGIPVVYEQRGFWEESWWSRVMEAETTRKDLLLSLSLPGAYVNRQRQEAQARSKATRIVTLSDVMVEHTIEQNVELGLTSPTVDVIHNAVDVDRFASVVRRQDLADELGIEGPVVGYISSMVPYEGIEVLADAYLKVRTVIEMAREAGVSEDVENTDAKIFSAIDTLLSLSPGSPEQKTVHDAALRMAAGPDPELLLVGEGISATKLQKKLGEHEGIHFMGRIPNEQVPDYYGLIDLFVVPRQPYRVCELVTPLKPFEAMASGRPIIMSNVRALQEIAEASGAALTFEAGNSKSLAIHILKLLNDDHLRGELGERGRSFVKEHRTWGGNAWKYANVYNSLGFEFIPSRNAYDKQPLSAFGIDAKAVLNGIPQLPEPQADGWFAHSTGMQSALDIYENGWLIPGFGRISWRDLNWCEAGETNRSAAFHLHSWDLLQPAMKVWQTTRDVFWLDWMLGIAEDWRRHVWESPTIDSMAWYDMAMAVRSARLSRLIYWAIANGREAEGLGLIPLLIEHSMRLTEPDLFNPRNNHGFFVAAAGLDFCKHSHEFVDADALCALSMKRMQEMMSRQFAPDGGHLEHSPAYHQMLWQSFQLAADEGLIEDPEILNTLSAAERAIGWFVQPDGNMLQFGDTDAKPFPGSCLARVTNPETIFQLSRGAQGKNSSEELFVLPQTGYAIVRSPQPQRIEDVGHENYLAVLAAFHSRTHKHADDLTFVWTHRGEEVLVDAGRFGYLDLLPVDSLDRQKGFYYSRPERQYVESTMAHNTISVDGANHERRKRVHYGSGIERAEHLADGSFVIVGQVQHATYLHKRSWKFVPGKSLEILDVMQGLPGDAEATAWFNLAGEIDIKRDGPSLVLALPNSGDVIRFSTTGEIVDLVRGQQDPLRGWRSPTQEVLTPTWGVQVALPQAHGTSAELTSSFIIQ